MKKRRHPKKHESISIDELQEFRNLLGPLAKDFSTSQLRQLRQQMHVAAEILLDFYLKRQAD